MARNHKAFMPPEGRFEIEQSLTFAADIWPLACTIWEILGMRTLFDYEFASRDDITEQQVNLLEKLPPKWWAKWEARYKYFNEAAEPNEGRYVMIGTRISKYTFNGHDGKLGFRSWVERRKQLFLDMMQSMLRFEPEKRLTIQGVLESDWMRKWVLPLSELEALCRQDILLVHEKMASHCWQAGRLALKSIEYGISYE